MTNVEAKFGINSGMNKSNAEKKTYLATLGQNVRDQ